ncbi:MAG: PAS domain-containing protein [Desulfamplus sp.]|nr:PAS domain-containing protein [Desulfamplus sp.]
MDLNTYEAILDSIDSPIVFVDNNHIIKYINKQAKIRYYEKRGYSDLIGKSLFDCHNQESIEYIKRIHDQLLAGETSIFLKENKDQEKITIVGVRNEDGQLLGYYERFENVTKQMVGEYKKLTPQP